MKEIKKKKSKPDPKILIPVIVGAVCVLMVAAVIIFMNPENTTAGQLQKKLELGDKYLESGGTDKQKSGKYVCSPVKFQSGRVEKQDGYV